MPHETLALAGQVILIVRRPNVIICPPYRPWIRTFPVTPDSPLGAEYGAYGVYVDCPKRRSPCGVALIAHMSEVLNVGNGTSAS